MFVVKDGVATVQPGQGRARRFDDESVIADGLEGGETVVTDGHLLLTNGTTRHRARRKPA